MMFEKVNPAHPDKIADRIAGAIVDLAYTKDSNPKIAVEVLIGHGKCNIIAETSVLLDYDDIHAIVERISGEKGLDIQYLQVPQDKYLARNQKDNVKCGDNGIFKGVPTLVYEQLLTELAAKLYRRFKSDGKYIIDRTGSRDYLVVCQSQAASPQIEQCIGQGLCRDRPCDMTINPLGHWTGGVNVDTGATNRKLGSDMGQCVTGGGLHGKDLSKADVSVNIYAYLKAQHVGKEVNVFCAIGDTEVDGIPYEKIVKLAGFYISSIGGFEKFAEWGLIRPSDEDFESMWEILS